MFKFTIPVLLLLSSSVAFAEGIPGFPRKKNHTGTASICCIQIDGMGPGLGGCRAAADHVAGFYTKMSRGSYKVSGRAVTASNWDQGKNLCKSTFILKPNLKGHVSHAGAGTVVLAQMTGWVVRHEVGHLLGMGQGLWWHSTGDGGFTGLAQGDKGDVMGGNGNSMSAPNFYHQGESWLPMNEIQEYDFAKPYYEIHRINSLKPDGLKVLYIRPSVWTAHKPPDWQNKKNLAKGEEPANGRLIMISWDGSCNVFYGPRWPTKRGSKCLGAHLTDSETGSSLKFADKVFDDYYDEWVTGLHLQVLPNTDPNLIRFKVDFASNPNPKRKDIKPTPTQK